MALGDTDSGAAAPAKVLSAAADGAAELFAANGGDIDSIFGNVGIRISDLADPVSELNLAQYCRLFEIAATATANDNIGLEFGHSFQPQRLGMLGYAALSSPTLVSALRNMEMLFPGHQGQSSFALIEDDGICWLSYRVWDRRIPERRQDAELSLGMFCNVIRQALGQHWQPLEIRFEHMAPDHSAAHERIFGCPVHFGRRSNAIAFLRSDLSAPMPGCEPYLFAVVNAFLRARIEHDEGVVDFAALVRNEIRSQLGLTLPTQPQIAAMMGLTSKEFQQHLRRSGLSFNDILRAARQELALHYLGCPDISLSEIALNLGYSELSAFSRAFRRWTGVSPQQFRRTMPIRPEVNSRRASAPMLETPQL